MTIGRVISGAEDHVYSVRREIDQNLWIELEQEGIDLILSILGPNGEPLLTVDGPSGLWGEEFLFFEAQAEVSYQLRIYPFDRHRGRGRYSLKVTGGQHPPGLQPAMRKLSQAGRLSHEGGKEAVEQASELYRGAFRNSRDLGFEALATRALFAHGILERQLHRSESAQKLLQQALAAWRRLGDGVGEAQALMEIASTARGLGQSSQVEAQYQQALDRWRALDDLAGQAWTLNYIGLIRARQVSPTAREVYEQSLELFRRLGAHSQVGVLLNNLGGLESLVGEPHAALDFYRQALAVHEQLGNRRLQAIAQHNVASIYQRTGRYQEALESYRASLETRRALGDRRGEARVLNSLGGTFLRLGDLDAARRRLDQALTLRRELRDQRGEVFTLQSLGWLESRQGHGSQALERFSRGLEISRRLGDPDLVVAGLMEMGRVSAETGRPDVALEYLHEAQDILAEGSNPWRQARGRRNLGEVLTQSGRFSEAVKYLEPALQTFESLDDPIGATRSLLALARARQKDPSPGSLQRSWQHVNRALEILEPMRSAVHSLRLRTTFLSNHNEGFALAIDIASDLHAQDPSAGWSARAFEISERAKARTFLDRLDKSGSRAVTENLQELQKQQAHRLDRLHAKVERRRRQLRRQGPSAETKRLAQEIQEILNGLEALESQMQNRHPGRHDSWKPRPLNAGQAQALLDDQTVLLEFSLGEHRSFLWWLAPNELLSFELPTRESIEALTRQVYQNFRLLDPGSQDQDDAGAARLSRMLLGPVADRLVDQRLAIVGDGALHFLPFAALPHPSGDGEPMIRHHELVNLPSASALAAQRHLWANRKPAPKQLAVLADPVFGPPDPRLAVSVKPGSADLPTSAAPESASTTDDIRKFVTRASELADPRLDRLPWSRWEAEALAKLVPGDQSLLALDFEADLDLVRSGRLKDYRYLHFATHGLVESEHPELSALVLSLRDSQGRPRDGLLRLPEIYHLDLESQLVVLSGCRTALGREMTGEGLVGLSRGFFAAGAQRLVASLWRVQDRSTAELMERFYRRLLQSENPVTPAAALRQAQLELLTDRRFADPYHWAAFAIYGDWK